ncbi:MAG: PilZ domain-containing protein [Nitrospira sp. CG24E]|nr:MAG: PilZ domain-containing protein [Nitrospira sp. CG24E]
MQGRKHARFAVQLPVSFRGDQLSDEGTILNLSEEGCAVTSETVASVAAYVQLAMQLRAKEEPVQVELAAVRWSSATRFGVEFIKIRPEEEARLKKFVKVLETTT